ncbi:MAG TPA: glycosyltransferase family 39 protein [Acidobacteriaceae bacterium]|nr:glycosyltransferase family 39 protein [Acidobacteriaceae bacterium]
MISTTAVPSPSSPTRGTLAAPRSWRFSSLALITLPWLILYLGGIFTPGLLDDVDSVYIEVAREMLLRHDYVTPFVDGIRFFDKPPLMYWLAAGSMHIFGIHDWAARLPLALGVLALLFAVYALGIRLFAAVSPTHAPDRGGLYAALAMALSIGPWLYTRFYIPDILIALWMTLAVHLFLMALDRTRIPTNPGAPRTTVPPGAPFMRSLIAHEWVRTLSQSPLLPMLGFAAVVALSVLTKGLIGLVFPILFAILYLAITRQLKLLTKLSLLPATLAFLAIALPWHILAALCNPAIAMPSGVGLPPRAGWAWFYLYNEHIARFLGRRIPHDYGQVPIPLFWLLLVLWLFPWAAFLPTAVISAVKHLRDRHARNHPPTIPRQRTFIPFRLTEALTALLLWAGIILGFFTISSRQEYYHLPALPALALLVGGLLAAADDHFFTNYPFYADPLRRTLRASLWFLVPIGTLLFLICGYFALFSPRPAAGVTLNDLLSSNPALYNLSLGHIFDLTGSAMGFFRWPLSIVAVSALVLGPIQHLVRRSAVGKPPHPLGPRSRTFAANLVLAAATTGILLAAHQGYVRFNPILGSKDIALAINAQKRPGDLILIDGELTSGSSLLFYTCEPAFLVNGHVNGPWFGSFWPDAPQIFLTDADLTRLWSGPHRIFLLTYHPTEREHFLAPQGPVHDLADSGGKTLLSNR